MTFNNFDNAPTLGLGTAAIGRPLYINLQSKGREQQSFAAFQQQGLELIESAYQLGVRYFDTAPGYGMAESLLTDWVSEKKDSTIEIASKWGYEYLANFNPNASLHERKEHSLQMLNKQWETTKRLGTPLTTYQIHSATFETGVLENEAILDRLGELKTSNGTLIGLTTTGSNQMDVLEKALDIQRNGKPLFDVFQVTYNVFEQSLASMARPLKMKNKRVIIKEALANGRVFRNTKFPQYEAAYNLLEQLSLKHSVGVDAIGLRFCMQTIPAYAVLSGASNIEQLNANLKAKDFVLDDEDIHQLLQLKISSEQYWTDRKLLDWH